MDEQAKDTRKENKELRAALLLKRKNGYDRIAQTDEAAISSYAEEYRRFLEAGKSERSCVSLAIAEAKARGFRAYEAGETLQAGDKVYHVNRDRALTLAVIGTESLREGANICAAHIDSPRLDLKQVPLYEEKELCYVKTHYFGGIRKYQWVSLPLALYGVVIRADGTRVDVCIGDGEDDPVFVVNDLLPHLSKDQDKKALSEGITGEQLNLLIGSRPFADDEGSERVKLAIMQILHEKYGITEEDFLSAELMAVPAVPARDVGFDRSMLGGYGQDDRVCAYAALRALLDLPKHPKKTAVCLLADKEEVGSMGVSGMQSEDFDGFMAELCEAEGVKLRHCFGNSFCLSAAVTAAYDPNFSDVFEKQNSAYLNYGLCISKYTGARGKSGSSDASAELVAYLRRTLDAAGVVWQTAELGKTDQGGGGTVAAYMANRNIDTIDAGVPTLSMHSPFEVVSKLDCYMTYRGIMAVYEAGGL